MAELREVPGWKNEQYAAKFRVLAENVKHYVKEEEAELSARAHTGKLDLIALGKQLEQAKASWCPMSHERTGKARRKTRESERQRDSLTAEQQEICEQGGQADFQIIRLVKAPTSLSAPGYM
jgi:hypothetical protein